MTAKGFGERKNFAFRTAQKRLLAEIGLRDLGLILPAGPRSHAAEEGVQPDRAASRRLSDEAPEISKVPSPRPSRKKAGAGTVIRSNQNTMAVQIPGRH